VLRDVRRSRAGGGERGDAPKERDGVDLLARLARLAPRIGKPVP
jgi:hypothetical protein